MKGEKKLRVSKKESCTLGCNFLEQIIQCLVRMSDQKNLLVGKIVIQVGYNLHSNICFTSSWWTDNHMKSRLHSIRNGFYWSSTTKNTQTHKIITPEKENEHNTDNSTIYNDKIYSGERERERYLSLTYFSDSSSSSQKSLRNKIQ